jgi:hypothetical protein
MALFTEKKGNNNQVIYYCYYLLHTREERGEQDCRGETPRNKHKPKPRLKPQEFITTVKKVCSTWRRTQR